MTTNPQHTPSRRLNGDLRALLRDRIPISDFEADLLRLLDSRDAQLAAKDATIAELLAALKTHANINSERLTGFCKTCGHYGDDCSARAAIARAKETK